MASAPGQPNQAQQRGSGFTNLSRIMQANQNNRLGSAIQSGITGGAQQVRQQLGDTRNQFQQASDTNNLASDQNQQIRENVLKNIAGGQTDISDPQAKQFAEFRGGQYTGPTGLDSSKVAQLGSRANELTTQAKNPFSQNTLQATIGANSKQPYTQGQVNLDRTLLGTVNPNVLGQTRQSVRGLPQNVARERDIAAGTGMLRQQQAAQFGKDTTAKLGGATTGIQTDVTNKVNEDLANQNTAFKDYQNAFTTGNISQLAGNNPELQKLVGQEYYNINPNDYGFLSKNAINKENVGTAQQKAQLDALAKLSGQSNDFLQNVNANQYDPTHSVGVDTTALQNAMAASKANYENTLKNTNVGVGGVDADTSRMNQYFGGSNVNLDSGIGQLQNAIADKQAEAAYWNQGRQPGGFLAGSSDQKYREAQAIAQAYQAKLDAAMAQKTQIGQQLGKGNIYK